ncbi:hypothetical protein ABRG53_c102 (plasmid) [Pseudanabaena sp. ABRG5-3]|nr:hypothetical protein ABRG53_c102 [Pseudanabaena sp. ABRG5-3]
MWIMRGASHFGTFGKDKELKPLVLGLGKLGLRQSEMLPIMRNYKITLMLLGIEDLHSFTFIENW